MTTTVSKEWHNIFDVEGYLQKHSSHGLRGVTGEEYYIELCNERDFLTAYRSCPPLKSIVGKRAKVFNTGEIQVLNSNSFKRGVGTTANDLRTLLGKPNPIQTTKQFQAQQNIYIDIYGYCPVYGIKAAGFESGVYSSVWNIPPWLFDLEYTKNWLGQSKLTDIFSKFFIIWNGQRREIDSRFLHFILDDGIGTDYDMNLTIPDSRLVGMSYPVSNIIAAYKSRNTLITKRGAIGILSNDLKDSSGLVAMRKGEKELIQKEFANYGIVGQPFQVIITEAGLKWQQIGYPTKDLMLFEEIEDSVNQLCDVFGWPVELMSRTKGVTFDNKDQAYRSVYRDTIIPESESRMEQLTEALVPKDANLIITRDFTEVEVLQDSAQNRAAARKAMNDALQIEWNNNLITRNMWLEQLGQDKVADPLFDLYKDQLTEQSGNEQNDTTSEDPGA